ncbi:diguanylate cyclase [Halorhodospira halochloris]|uniref:diguanylate cyclase n=1 Tax=Halorhodospira halochloris TaxID=1052 RepID=UPI001EE8FF8E|nr:diguanylate cyclase [Halorhodospira halochloris]MCG5548631.1 diguanylate cyclase [Halorhodospira halochloris]
MPSRAQLSIVERVLATDVTAVIVLDEDGALVYANNMAYRMLGIYLPDGSTTDDRADTADDNDTAELTQQLPDEIGSFRWIASTGTPLRDVRLTLKQSSAGQRVFSINASPLPRNAHETPCVALSIHDFTEQYKYYEEALHKSQERLQLATEAAGIGIWERDLINDTFHWDERIPTIYGIKYADLPSNYEQWRKIVLAEDLPALERSFRQARINHTRFETDFRIHAGSGEIRHIRGFGQYIYDNSGNAIKLVGVNEDITERKQVEHELAQSKERLEEAQRIARLGHWIASTDKGLLEVDLWWSPVIYEIFGRNPESFKPDFKSYLRAVHPEDRGEVIELLRRLRADHDHRSEHRIIRTDGVTKWVRAIARTEDQSPVNARRILGTIQDITEQRELQQELEYRASHDPLTDLYNRAKLQQQLRAAQAAYERHGTPFALVIADVDHFKAVNDRWGHSVGDAVLWEIGRRMSSQLRETDFLGRWGGEEFLILANHTDESGAAQLADRIRESICGSEIQGIGTITTSFGVAATEPGTYLEVLENRADKALYAAKERGRNTVMKYSQL